MTTVLVRNWNFLAALAALAISLGPLADAARRQSGFPVPASSRDAGDCPELTERTGDGGEDADPKPMAAWASAGVTLTGDWADTWSLPKPRYRREPPQLPPPDSSASLL